MKENLNLSVSRVQLFEQCSQKYYYRYILKLPDSNTYHSAIGTFTHKALQFLVLEYLKGKSIRVAAQQAFIDAKQDPEVVDLGYLVTPEISKQVKDYLKQYVFFLEKNPEKISSFLQAEREFQYIIPDHEITINGYIDRIDQVDNDTVRIIDYKTGKSDYITPFQLVVYSLPIQKDFPDKTIIASYEMVKEQFREIPIEVTENLRQEAIKKFINIGSQVRDLINKNDPSQWPPSPSYLCNYCPYRVRCAQDNAPSWPSR